MERGGGEGSEEARGREREREREWEEAAEAVAYDSSTWPPPVVVVCGPGNSGKSAFSRLLLNTLIARYKRVAYLDTDVGQPEFTPPGFVSLHVLEEQAKDLTMIYLRAPKRCFFFGDVAAHKNPKLLLSYIFGLYDYFIKELYRFNEADNPHKSAIPIVINTSGWVKGIGLHVLSDILRYVSPTDVIRLNTTAEGKNIPGGAFWLDTHEGYSGVNLVEIRAAQNSPPHQLVKKEARMIRDVRLIAYFRQCLPRDFPIFSSDDLVQGIAAIDPFQLLISKIQVIDLHSQISSDSVYDFLAGTIVGIGSSSSAPLSTECSSPWCMGLGFIKAIDIPGDCIHLITPVSHQLLESVDIIFPSCIAVPEGLFQMSDGVDDITARLRDL
ncbi:polynucleotide 5'-hydroxyl-kinase NOL9-like [Hordeum vulgare subsp. vulgare]|uniref:Predicted protein n=1 Tax=Hordeum vulgare subsp. vulgare TaxID=112509 RepID=F2EJJ3_HORVV|nr:polynucleotide 5'-hydroxyl-kinase NOL9-like [Hordeum vulgare subsp. vulgare]BAK07515.1 predicted protein [Hordeum vulgare subsp. vulgare]